MHARFSGPLEILPDGPLAAQASGGEDLRSLVLGVSATLWPSSSDTWFSQGGFALDMRWVDSMTGAIDVEASCPPGSDTLPLASMAITVEAALARSARFALRTAHVSTVVDGEQPTTRDDGWSFDGWATRLLRGTPPPWRAVIELADGEGSSLDLEPVIESLSASLLLVPAEDYPVRVEGGAEGGRLTITPSPPSLLGVAVLLDALRLVCQETGYRGALECSVEHEAL